jgi:uncharacterized protein YbjT (DUF2867 family)
MSVSVTAAANRVSSLVVAQLAAAGIEVRPLARSTEKATFPAGVVPYKGELLVVDATRAATRGVDAVFLLRPVTAEELARGSRAMESTRSIG